MKIRVAGAADAAALTVIYRESYAALMAPAYEPAVLAAALPAMTAPQPDLITSGAYFVAEDAGALIGGGGWSFASPGTGKVVAGLAHIRHFAVTPNRAKTGVGRALFQRCRQTAQAKGAVRLSCNSSLNGVPFYAAMGFAVVARREVTMGEGLSFPVVEMALTLS